MIIVKKYPFGVFVIMILLYLGLFISSQQTVMILGYLISLVGFMYIVIGLYRINIFFGIDPFIDVKGEMKKIGVIIYQRLIMPIIMLLKFIFRIKPKSDESPSKSRIEYGPWSDSYFFTTGSPKTLNELIQAHIDLSKQVSTERKERIKSDTKIYEEIKELKKKSAEEKEFRAIKEFKTQSWGVFYMFFGGIIVGFSSLISIFGIFDFEILYFLPDIL